MLTNLLRFVANPASAFVAHSVSYITLAVTSSFVAAAIGVALGAAVARRPALAFLAANVSGVMRAVPIIAFLAIAVPYLGLGFRPALVALMLLGIPPVLLNTATGIRGIDPAIIDAARGMGMTPWQILTRIQTPLVLPIIAAGIRTAVVQIVATATLAAIIGAGGYGEYILSGLYQVDTTQILAGALPVALLAMLAESGLSWVQYLVTPRGLRGEWGM